MFFLDPFPLCLVSDLCSGCTLPPIYPRRISWRNCWSAPALRRGCSMNMPRAVSAKFPSRIPGLRYGCWRMPIYHARNARSMPGSVRHACRRGAAVSVARIIPVRLKPVGVAARRHRDKSVTRRHYSLVLISASACTLARSRSSAMDAHAVFSSPMTSDRRRV